MTKSLRMVAVVCVALGGVLGMAGTMTTSQTLRAVFWAIDGTALVIATSLLALMFFRKGSDGVAAGFLVYAIGEAVMLSGTAGSLEASVPSFAAGTALWSAGLLLTSVPKEFALWTRVFGAVAGILFAVVSLRILGGEVILPISKPLPYFAYPFLVLTFVGWILALLKAD